MSEMWKDIPGYEGLYQASTAGRIRTAEGKVTSSARFPHRVWKQRIMRLKTQKKRDGRSDSRVELWKDGTHKTMLVARLVALTWCDGYEDGLTVNHIDGNSMNNEASNLEWVSMKENIRKAFATGLNKNKIEVVVIAEDGSEMNFVSMREADRFLGRPHGYTWNCVRNGGKSSYGYTIKVAGE